MTPTKPVLGRDWPKAADKEVTPAEQLEFSLHAFGDLLRIRHVILPSKLEINILC
jgi:hypothetical protein